MTDREKLIRLLIRSGLYGVNNTTGEAADHLIANGVVVREKGEWISLEDCANAGVYCSVCHKKVYKEDYAWCNRKNKLRSDFCPNCGADMRKGGDNDG